MCLRFAFLLITRVTMWLRLFRREEAWQTAAILILRRQLTVLQRRQPRRPRLTWADRALLATLLDVIPRTRRQELRLLVTPVTILRWHHDIVRRRWAARSMRGKSGRSATRRNITALVLRLARENPEWGYRRIHGGTGRPGSTDSGVHGVGDSEECRNRPRHGADRHPDLADEQHQRARRPAAENPAEDIRLTSKEPTRDRLDIRGYIDTARTSCPPPTGWTTCAPSSTSAPARTRSR